MSYFEPRYYTSGNAAHALLGDPAAEERETEERDPDGGARNKCDTGILRRLKPSP